MLTEERYAAILKLLEEKKAVSVLELTELLNSSESTIRRDLTALHQMGKLTKVHGGATSINGVYQMTEDKTSVRHNLHVEEKNRIAQCAASLVHKNDFVFLDAGTTTVRMVEHQKHSKATFVTNGVACALRLPELGFQGYVLGGALKPGTGAVVGAQALTDLEGYNFTKAFLGINGITLRQGFTTPDPEAAVKRKASQRAYLTYSLADSSKFETVSAASVLPLEKASIITDHLPDRAYLEHTIVKEVL